MRSFSAVAVPTWDNEVTWMSQIYQSLTTLIQTRVSQTHMKTQTETEFFFVATLSDVSGLSFVVAAELRHPASTLQILQKNTLNGWWGSMRRIVLSFRHKTFQTPLKPWVEPQMSQCGRGKKNRFHKVTMISYKKWEAAVGVMGLLSFPLQKEIWKRQFPGARLPC